MFFLKFDGKGRINDIANLEGNLQEYITSNRTSVASSAPEVLASFANNQNLEQE
jgi:hypothetical protein